MKRMLLTLTAAFVAAGVVQAPGAVAATYKIGVAGPMTGEQSKMGTDFQNGVKLAVEEWNAANPNYRMEIVIGDDQADPRQAVAVANKFVNEGVLAVIGHFNSSCSIPASTIYHDNNMVQITPASTNPQLTDRGLWNVFRTCGRDDQQGKVAADFVAARKIKRVAILHDKTTYGQGLADAFRDVLKKSHKIEPVFYGGISKEDKDYSAVLTSVKAQNPEVVFFGGIYPQAGLLVKQMRDLGIKARFMSGDGVIDPEFVKIAGKEAAEGTWLTFSPDIKNIPEAKKVVETYEKKFGPVGPYSIYAYTAAKILFESIKATGAKSTKDSKKIAEHIRKTTWNTPLGRIQYDQKGDVRVSPYVVYETRNGEFVQITGLKQQAQR
ncbi:MAG TPA: branched-chain amino acid ABC transporter substrate-binding protein [Thermodesulfobacteriota bacterium]|nr:branched-chain amino acid ABC transporter substrate-binding protein [Thermodesulfobacteriota bacterium]